MKYEGIFNWKGMKTSATISNMSSSLHYNLEGGMNHKSQLIIYESMSIEKTYEI